MQYKLAQINIAKMLAPIDSPVMAEFVANLDGINTLAEGSEGFVWRLKDEENNATAIRVFDDDFIIVNMSVWENAEFLHRFVYGSMHVEIFKQRKKWFEQMKDMHMAMWYIPAGYTLTASDGVERLSYLRANGETPYAFTYRSKFTAEDAVEYKNMAL
ncbi:DUF3291 domain-containing protein [Mucilaginibacter sp.]|uniref:DUF3291 domain-containing protein n=1 Tax=Mucilaginibacter sp. TaxID=1882438 RepID=UPI0032669FB7